MMGARRVGLEAHARNFYGVPEKVVAKAWETASSPTGQLGCGGSSRSRTAISQPRASTIVAHERKTYQ